MKNPSEIKEIFDRYGGMMRTCQLYGESVYLSPIQIIKVISFSRLLFSREVQVHCLQLLCTLLNGRWVLGNSVGFH